jgi:streptogramin lyase
VVPSRTKGISIARGQGSIWVDALEDTSRTWIDEETGAPVDETPIGFPRPGIFVEGPYVWVAAEHGLLEVSPATGKTETAFEVDSTGDLPAAANEDSVWVFAEGRVVRVDTSTGEVVDSFKVDVDVSGLSFGEGSLWAIDKLNGSLVEFDPRAGKERAHHDLPGNLDALIVGEGYAWVLDETAGTITAVDVARGEVQAPLRVGRKPAGVAFGLGALWVGDLEAAEIWRIDPLTLHTTRIAAPGPVAGIVADEGDRALWLALSRERTATQF